MLGWPSVFASRRRQPRCSSRLGLCLLMKRRTLPSPRTLRARSRKRSTTSQSAMTVRQRPTNPRTEKSRCRADTGALARRTYVPGLSVFGRTTAAHSLGATGTAARGLSNGRLLRPFVRYEGSVNPSPRSFSAASRSRIALGPTPCRASSSPGPCDATCASVVMPACSRALLAGRPRGGRSPIRAGVSRVLMETGYRRRDQQHQRVPHQALSRWGRPPYSDSQRPPQERRHVPCPRT